MIAFGPVAEAARGGHGNPFFDLSVGFFVLAITWIDYRKKNTSQDSGYFGRYRHKRDLRRFHLFRYR